MPKPILICKNPATALDSVSKILGLQSDVLIENLKQLNISDLDCNDEIESKIRDVFLNMGQFNDFDVVWFHGTRLNESHSIKRDGILPTSQVKLKIREYLQDLSDGLTKFENSPVSLSYFVKNSGNHIDEGPFGLLFYETAAYPSGSNVSYIECPELVADLAGEMFGKNSIHLINRFRQQTHPYIIHFQSSPIHKIETLSRALIYTYLTLVDEQDSITVANSNSKCFDGKGSPVKPEMIIEIEKLRSLVIDYDVV